MDSQPATDQSVTLDASTVQAVRRYRNLRAEDERIRQSGRTNGDAWALDEAQRAVADLMADLID